MIPRITNCPIFEDPIRTHTHTHFTTAQRSQRSQISSHREKRSSSLPNLILNAHYTLQPEDEKYGQKNFESTWVERGPSCRVAIL